MNHYYLLPFRFERIKEQELLVNELGDFIFVPTGTTERIHQTPTLAIKRIFTRI